jgi:hypothetical protein
MYIMQDRRRFLATLSSAGAAGLIGPSNSVAQEAPPETTTIRLARSRSICIAPQYVVGDLLQELSAIRGAGRLIVGPSLVVSTICPIYPSLRFHARLS